MCIFEILWLQHSEIAGVFAQSDYWYPSKMFYNPQEMKEVVLHRKERRISVGINTSMMKMKLVLKRKTSFCSVLLKMFL